MEIDSSYVGARSTVVEVALSPRQTMSYAAALGDNNSHYFDDTRDGGSWAPPMLAVALTWPLSSNFSAYWGETDFPVAVLMRQVHYNESITWVRPMRSDETLRIQGEIVAMVPHPSGTVISICYTASGRGGVVFTEHISGLLRGVGLRDGGQIGAEIPPLESDPEATTGGWERSISIDPLAAHVYDGCSEIIFPIHTSVAFARQVGLPDPIYHGTATLGLALREILDREGGGDPEKLLAVHCGFRGMVFPGTEITVCVQAIVTGDAERVVYFDVRNGAGESALRHGRVHLRLNN